MASARPLEGKVAIVTGGASSIGRAVALAYGAAGAKVIVADIRATSRDPEEPIATADVIGAAGGEAFFQQVDVTDEESVKGMVAEGVKRFGRVDIMAAVAGIAPEASLDKPTPIWEMPVDLYDIAIKVNGRGLWLCNKYAIKQMLAQDALPAPAGTPPGLPPSRGWIVNMASIFSTVAVPGTSAYSISKTLALGVTRAAALDAAPVNIHVNAICPGYVDTTLTKEQWAKTPEMRTIAEQLHPLNGGRFGLPGDVAPAAVFLASEGARWMTGSTITIDGGYTAQ